jgi:phosphatidylserine/phosphatidylglycerophosphate/cardiolipin synthase-like enzyme
MAGPDEIPQDEAPIGLLHRREANLTMPWFVERAKYPPRAGNFILPLINGHRAFKSVEAALKAAKKTIDIISWGFDPGMRLSPPSGERLGDILHAKARTGGVKVRVLIWKNAAANAGENNILGDGLMGSGGGSGGMGSGVGSTSGGDASRGSAGGNGYGGASRPTGSGGVQTGDPEARTYSRNWFSDLPSGLSFRVRDYSLGERTELKNAHIDRHGNFSNIKQRLALSMLASHHQKVVLVDYEDPTAAVGFVMGHNFQRAYWDNDEHAYYNAARGPFGPWQDLSSMVVGPVLYDLNDNFTAAWIKAQPTFGSDQPLETSRKSIRPEAFSDSGARLGEVEMAQITRTEPLESDLSILASYKLALANAREYVYFENQYFRHIDTAMEMRRMQRQLKQAGRKRELYVFVVTNVPDDHGRLNTYDTLRALGKGDRMPQVERNNADGESSSERTLRRSDLDGLNVIVCTLTSVGQQLTPARGVPVSSSNGFPAFAIAPPQVSTVYQPIYVHSKLLLVDDVFFTLGSANVNERSLFNDTELNIACPSPRLTRYWKERLWKLHTGRGTQATAKDEFKLWADVARENLELLATGKPLNGTLTEFFDTSSSGGRAD